MSESNKSRLVTRWFSISLINEIDYLKELYRGIIGTDDLSNVYLGICMGNNDITELIGQAIRETKTHLKGPIQRLQDYLSSKVIIGLLVKKEGKFCVHIVHKYKVVEHMNKYYIQKSKSLENFLNEVTKNYLNFLGEIISWREHEKTLNTKNDLLFNDGLILNQIDSKQCQLDYKKFIENFVGFMISIEILMSYMNSGLYAYYFTREYQPVPFSVISKSRSILQILVNLTRGSKISQEERNNALYLLNYLREHLSWAFTKHLDRHGLLCDDLTGMFITEKRSRGRSLIKVHDKNLGRILRILQNPSEFYTDIPTIPVRILTITPLYGGRFITTMFITIFQTIDSYIFLSCPLPSQCILNKDTTIEFARDCFRFTCALLSNIQAKIAAGGYDENLVEFLRKTPYLEITYSQDRESLKDRLLWRFLSRKSRKYRSMSIS